MERARGTYILNADADDYYLTKDAFSILYDAARRYGDPALIHFCHVRKHWIRTEMPQGYSGEAVVDWEEFSAKEYPRLLCSIWKNTRLSENVWRKLYRRDLLEKLPSSDTTEHIFHGDDIILNLQMLENVPSCVFIPDRLYAYRLSGGTKRFSPVEMVNLDTTKKYQLQYWERWDGGALKEDVLRELYVGVAQKLWRFALRGEAAVGGEELHRLLTEAFALPRIALAQQYLLEHPEDQQVPLELLRSADPKRYIEVARAVNREHRFKRKLRTFVNKF